MITKIAGGMAPLAPPAGAPDLYRFRLRRLFFSVFTDVSISFVTTGDLESALSIGVGV